MTSGMAGVCLTSLTVLAASWPDMWRNSALIPQFPPIVSPRRLTFTWWGCCGLCFPHKPTDLPTPFHSVLVSLSVFMALSTVFHSINSPDNSPLSHFVLPVLFLPYWSFQLSISLRKSPSALK